MQNRVGAEIELDFFGSAIGMYVLAGPDAGTIEYSIDGGDVEKADLYHHFSGGLHYPRTVMLSADLEQGNHHAVIRISEAKNEKSKGHAIRILHFVVN